ncbi:TlpA family protein disulfide reductase [Sinorhizobium meliloti]|uniref:TlpA disulfide reductase family protein n=1 Tax=Rhizobium meliloti TaxID=382 RepID=UPI000FD84230|nr:TlpA disulfide reductase family protein [Sinorhizobium meliloti]RVH87602.1 TlpA family protein disulfide reductase [Sinorhizobium meliloti]RVM26481.1 TlpA family protein disulfide reductase [Sinorhizobium meliloti]RVM43790.1 TlpA family protein disulfide reductase [Sinorhizobium meliloti]RVN54408.1 TlpA family protein disulfide reductase [Sinorhizobium meliloti]RVN98011.1 TlpA family protein disulfide reductase [Sinorhizobium meliloti]
MSIALTSARVLQMDSLAPALKVGNWIRGEPLASFQPGKLYILEFCGTSCDGCEGAMLNLIELQESYKDSGVEVVAVAAHERAASADEARGKLDAWLAKFPTLNFPVGFDDTGAMDTLWMEPSFSVEIPQAFVIDRDGYIAFIGHPRKLHGVLPQVLDGTWRTSAQAKAAERKRIAVDEPKARKGALLKPIRGKRRAAEEIGDWKTALAAVEEGIALDPDDYNLRAYQVHLLLDRMCDMETGLAVLWQFVREAIDRGGAHWLVTAMTRSFHPSLPSAERFAMVEVLSEHILALDLAQCNLPASLVFPMVARYYYEIGNKDRAVELIELALKSLDGPDPDMHGLKKDLKPYLLQTLANYKGEEVCYGDVCVVPRTNISSGATPKAEQENPAERGALE